MWRSIKEFGKKPLFYSTIVAGSYTLYDYASWNMSMWWQQNKVVTTMRKGCLPNPPKLAYLCERNELVQALYDNVLHPPETSMFRVVVGPLGCGKTWCITTAIRTNKQGVIYIDAVSLSCLAKTLGEAAGMTFPKKISLFEIIRSKTSMFHREPVLFSLPDGNSRDQIEYVLEILGEMSLRYQKKYNEIPTLVIDSTDNIVKEKPEMFQALLKKGKSLVNDKVMNIVFVSSERNVIPVLKAASERSRCARIFHVPDIGEEKAVDILVKSKCNKSLAKKVANLCDGRLILLSLALDILATAKEGASNDDLFMEIEESLLSRVRADYDRSKILIGSVFNEKAAILNALTIKSMDLDELLDYMREGYGIKDGEAVHAAIDDLIKGNYVVMISDTVVAFQTMLHKTYWMKRRQYLPLSKKKK